MKPADPGNGMGDAPFMFNTKNMTLLSDEELEETSKALDHVSVKSYISEGQEHKPINALHGSEKLQGLIREEKMIENSSSYRPHQDPSIASQRSSWASRQPTRSVQRESHHNASVNAPGGAVFDFRRLSSSKKPASVIRATKHTSISLKQLLQQDAKSESPREGAAAPDFSSIEMRFINKEEDHFRHYSNPWGEQVRKGVYNQNVADDQLPELEDAENVSSKLLVHS